MGKRSDVPHDIGTVDYDLGVSFGRWPPRPTSRDLVHTIDIGNISSSIFILHFRVSGFCNHGTAVAMWAKRGVVMVPECSEYRVGVPPLPGIQNSHSKHSEHVIDLLP